MVLAMDQYRQLGPVPPLPLDVMSNILSFVEAPFVRSIARCDTKKSLGAWAHVRQVNRAFNDLARTLHPQIDQKIRNHLATRLAVTPPDDPRDVSLAPLYLRSATCLELCMTQFPFYEAQSEAFERMFSFFSNLQNLHLAVSDYHEEDLKRFVIKRHVFEAMAFQLNGAMSTGNFGQLRDVSVDCFLPGLLQGLSKLPNLERLRIKQDLAYTCQGDEPLTYLALTHLTVGGEGGNERRGYRMRPITVSDRSLIFRNNFPNLTHLSLLSAGGETCAFEPILRQKKLTHITIYEHKYFLFPSRYPTEKISAQLKFHTLYTGEKSFHYSDDFKDVVFSDIKKILPSLQDLTITSQDYRKIEPWPSREIKVLSQF